LLDLGSAKAAIDDPPSSGVRNRDKTPLPPL